MSIPRDIGVFLVANDMASLVEKEPYIVVQKVVHVSSSSLCDESF